MGHIRLGLLQPELPLGARLLSLLADAGIRADLLQLPLTTLPGHSSWSAGLLLLEAAEHNADTLAALRQLRQANRLPCVVLQPRRSTEGMTALLEAGADEVLDQAQPPQLALARIRAVLRRAEWGTQLGQAAPATWELVPSRRQLLRPCGADAELTTAEFDLFRLLAEAEGRIVCRS